MYISAADASRNSGLSAKSWIIAPALARADGYPMSIAFPMSGSRWFTAFPPRVNVFGFLGAQDFRRGLPRLAAVRYSGIAVAHG
jgi:hypothetical protein